MCRSVNSMSFSTSCHFLLFSHSCFFIDHFLHGERECHKALIQWTPFSSFCMFTKVNWYFFFVFISKTQQFENKTVFCYAFSEVIVFQVYMLFCWSLPPAPRNCCGDLLTMDPSQLHTLQALSIPMTKNCGEDKERMCNYLCQGLGQRGLGYPCER